MVLPTINYFEKCFWKNFIRLRDNTADYSVPISDDTTKCGSFAPNGIAKQLTSCPQDVHPAERSCLIRDNISYNVRQAVPPIPGSTACLMSDLTESHAITLFCYFTILASVGILFFNSLLYFSTFALLPALIFRFLAVFKNAPEPTFFNDVLLNVTLFSLLQL